MIVIFSVLFLLVSPSALVYAPEPEGENQSMLIIHVDGLENSEGSLLVALWNSEEGFPDEEANAYRGHIQELCATEATVILEEIPYGTYAVAVIHDENNNQELDTGTFGIPDEGIGFSNNIVGGFGPPDFDEVSFRISSNSKIISITMYYY